MYAIKRADSQGIMQRSETVQRSRTRVWGKQKQFTCFLCTVTQKISTQMDQE